MSRTGGHNPSLDGTTDKGHVADDVEQLVAGALVVPYQRLVLDIAQVGCIHVWNAQYVGQLVEVLLRHLTLVDYDGIVQTSALDEVGVEQRFDIANKDKRSCSSYFLGII